MCTFYEQKNRITKVWKEFITHMTPNLISSIYEIIASQNFILKALRSTKVGSQFFNL